MRVTLIKRLPLCSSLTRYSRIQQSRQEACWRSAAARSALLHSQIWHFNVSPSLLANVGFSVTEAVVEDFSVNHATRQVAFVSLKKSPILIIGPHCSQPPTLKLVAGNYGNDEL